MSCFRKKMAKSFVVREICRNFADRWENPDGLIYNLSTFSKKEL